MKIFPQQNDTYTRTNQSKYQTEENNGIKNNGYLEAPNQSLSQKFQGDTS